MSKKVLVTAHSGCMNTPMNSLEYIKKSIELGADIIEVDIRFTKNNEILLSHNELEEEKIDSYLRLQDVIDIVKPHKDIKLNLDMKEFDKFDVLEAVIIDCDMVDRVFLSGVKPPVVQRLKTINYKLKYLVNYRLDCSRNTDIDYLNEIAKDIKELGAFGVNLHYPRASRELIKTLHHIGKFVSAWTVDDEETMDKLIEMEIDSISTDRIDILIEKVKNLNK
ncbi:glycerophosphodiester phosphodiesterase [Clostridium sp. ZS2-4]|uniref:glycerophosphodiester phosphodiesterase n=1 Tax=Clostridium sp. ZS2-4 TaxID=2987703 RepID=UPI00227A506F|nr:glycerophosphodiester phosphodiesterase [Clostridium sp. ZS2-4]MCY6354444.1 glycerophosphodiester phosphodiesterase [Clostridium sp. ZS2-4]